MADKFDQGYQQLIHQYLNVTNLAEYPLLLVGREDETISTMCFYATTIYNRAEGNNSTIYLFHNHGEGNMVPVNIASGCLQVNLPDPVTQRLRRLEAPSLPVITRSSINNLIESDHFVMPLTKVPRGEKEETLVPLNRKGLLQGASIKVLYCDNTDDSEVQQVSVNLRFGAQSICFDVDDIDSAKQLFIELQATFAPEDMVVEALQKLAETTHMMEEPLFFPEVNFSCELSRLVSEHNRKSGKYDTAFPGLDISDVDISHIVSTVLAVDKKKAPPSEAVEDEPSRLPLMS